MMHKRRPKGLHFTAAPSQHGVPPCWAAARGLLNAKRGAPPFHTFSAFPTVCRHLFLAGFARDSDLLQPLWEIPAPFTRAPFPCFPGYAWQNAYGPDEKIRAHKFSPGIAIGRKMYYSVVMRFRTRQLPAESSGRRRL